MEDIISNISFTSISLSLILNEEVLLREELQWLTFCWNGFIPLGAHVSWPTNPTNSDFWVFSIGNSKNYS